MKMLCLRLAPHLLLKIYFLFLHKCRIWSKNMLTYVLALPAFFFQNGVHCYWKVDIFDDECASIKCMSRKVMRIQYYKKSGIFKNIWTQLSSFGNLKPRKDEFRGAVVAIVEVQNSITGILLILFFSGHIIVITKHPKISSL